MIRAFFFDVDGTLLSHTQNMVPAGTRRALDKQAIFFSDGLKTAFEETIDNNLAPGNRVVMGTLPSVCIRLTGEFCLEVILGRRGGPVIEIE